MSYRPENRRTSQTLLWLSSSILIIWTTLCRGQLLLSKRWEFPEKSKTETKFPLHPDSNHSRSRRISSQAKKPNSSLLWCSRLLTQMKRRSHLSSLWLRTNSCKPWTICSRTTTSLWWKCMKLTSNRSKSRPRKKIGFANLKFLNLDSCLLIND